jgi:hypothetical protein
MRTTFIVFFSLITLAMVASLLDNWIIQAQFHGGVNLARAVFQIALVGWFLYLLWRRSTAGYILTLFYAISDTLIYSHELSLYYLFGDISAKLPPSAVMISCFLIGTTLLAVVLIGLDYVDYRERRKP